MRHIRGTALGSTFPLVAAVLSAVLIAVTAAFSGGQPDPSSDRVPRVTSITQITRDGLSKTSLLSDDAYLYVTEWPGAHHVIAKLPLTGSERSVISSPFSSVQALDLSGDGKKLLVAPVEVGSSDAAFWTVPVGNGIPERIGDITGRDATWSPDGKYLAFCKGSVLYFANANGTQVRELFSAGGEVFAPRFSPDGQRLRFTVGNVAQSTTSLWEVDRDGSNPHALLPNWEKGATACCGNWTSDGRFYIFQVTESTPTTITTLWALPAGPQSDNSRAPVQLTSGPISFGNVFPGRNSQSLWAIGVAPAAQAVKYNPAKQNFVPLLDGISATDLDFSPDGKWVTYVTIPDGILWRCRADGTDQLQLTSARERTALPHWSPDGKWIAYVAMEPGKSSRILVAGRDGGAPKEVSAGAKSQIDANWSPDGTRIMFGAYVRDAQGIDIRIGDLKTHEVVVVPGSEGLFSPRWSPNGRYIAALSPDFTKVMRYDFRTRQWSTWFTEPAGAVSYPVWSADSEYLTFDDLVTDEESIRRVKIGERQPERMFVLRGIERYPGVFGLWSGRMPDGSWMFVRDRSTQEVYQLSLEQSSNTGF